MRVYSEGVATTQDVPLLDDCTPGSVRSNACDREHRRARGLAASRCGRTTRQCSIPRTRHVLGVGLRAGSDRLDVDSGTRLPISRKAAWMPCGSGWRPRLWCEGLSGQSVGYLNLTPAQTIPFVHREVAAGRPAAWRQPRVTVRAAAAAPAMLVLEIAVLVVGARGRDLSPTLSCRREPQSPVSNTTPAPPLRSAGSRREPMPPSPSAVEHVRVCPDSPGARSRSAPVLRPGTCRSGGRYCSRRLEARAVPAAVSG